MKAQDIGLIRIPGSPVVSPDGRRFGFVETYIEDGNYHSRILVGAVDGDDTPKPLTDGIRDFAPAWSPDGRSIAFLRAQEATPPQLFVVPAEGGAARRLTDLPLGVGSPVTTRHAKGAAAPVWSPDSRHIAYVARVRQESGDAVAASHRRITRLRYRIDELEYVHDRRSQVFVTELESGRGTMLTDGRWDHWDISWHPDGRHLLAATVRHDDNDLDEVNDIVVLDLSGGERVLTDGSTTVGLPTAVPDGSAVVFVGIGPMDGDRNDARARNVGLWSIPYPAGGTPRRLTDAETQDLDDGRTRPLVIDATGVLAGRLDRGAVGLHLFDWDGVPRELIGGRRQVTDYAVAGGTVVATVADAGSAGEVVVLRDGRERTRTALAAGLAAAGLAPAIEVETTAPDGYPVHGWLFLPATPGPHPLLLHIHGGPDIQVGHALSDEAQVLAGAGFAVLIGNPRGSAGYGEAHARAIRGRLGTVDADDLLALLDEACRRDDIASDRVGVLGGSYGGFMTAWLAAHHGHRFRAAVCERGVYSWTSMMGTSDLAIAAASMTGEDPAAWVRQSPLTYAAQMDIPVMVMHWEGDRRVPFEQAQQLFGALRARRKKDAELVVFPGGNHNTSRNGPPAQRLERFGLIIDWFGKHLRTGA